MLPHLKSRPVVMLRAPSGIEGTLFFQKHASALSIPGLRLLDRRLDPGHAPLLEIASATALAALPGRWQPALERVCSVAQKPDCGHEATGLPARSLTARQSLPCRDACFVGLGRNIALACGPAADDRL